MPMSISWASFDESATNGSEHVEALETFAAKQHVIELLRLVMYVRRRSGF